VITSLAQLVRKAVVHIADRHGVDAGLDDVIRALEEPGAPSSAVSEAKRLVRDRARAHRAVAHELDQLRGRMAYLAEVLAFREEGWPERKAEIEALFAEDPLEGLAAWLDDWFRAASYRWVDALVRLAEVEAIPPGAELLLERCRTAARGLAEPSWYAARGMLEAGAAGIAVGGRVVPHQSVRKALRLLLIRLILDEFARESDEARGERLMIEADQELSAASPSPAADALRARWHRLRDEEDHALRRLEEAGEEVTADLDVAVERILRARLANRFDFALEAARAAIDALPTLSDIDAQLARLVSSPPAELWIAVAERALEEGDLDAHAEGVEGARMRALWSDYGLLAAASELAAQGAEARQDPAEVRVAALTDAGAQRVMAGQLELAIPLFEQALELLPEAADASLRLADCLVTVHASQPLSSSRSQVERGLGLIRDVQSRGGINAGNSWSYLAEAVARQKLATAASPEIDDQAWRAFLAVCRSIVHQPEAANRWCDLASAGQVLDLYSLPITVAEYAERLDRNEQSIAQSAQAFTNAGRLSEALERLTGDPWDQVVRAYVLLRQGDPYEAVRLLRAADLDPSWSWGYAALVVGLLLTDSVDDAIAEAELLRARWERRLDEVEGLTLTAWTAVVVGDFDRAEELARRLDEFDGSGEAGETAGIARLLRNDAGGIADLEERFLHASNVRVLEEWRSLSVPTLRVLADRYGATLPPLGSVDEAIARRREELQAVADPVAELAAAPAGSADEEVVALARAMGTALVELARHDAAAALRALEPAVARHGDDVELKDLWRYAEERRLASEAVTAAVRDALAVAASSLRSLLDVADDRADEILRRESDLHDEDVEKLMSAVEEVARTPGYEAAAHGLLYSLGIGSELTEPLRADPPRPLQPVMPPSWFDGYLDPLNDHPLFLRYIPELRARADWEVPGINVRTDEALEPDGYRILALEDVVEEGRVSREYAYGTPEAIALLAPGLEETAEPDDSLGHTRVPVARVEAAGGLARLVTMVAEEVVVRQVGEVSRQHAERLEAAATQAI